MKGGLYRGSGRKWQFSQVIFGNDLSRVPLHSELFGNIAAELLIRIFAPCLHAGKQTKAPIATHGK